MEKIKETVLSVMEGLAAKREGKTKAGPEEVLKKVLTKKELKHIKFNYFKAGVLAVKVDSSSWLYNFNLKKEDLLKQLKLEDKQIKELRLRIGEVK